MGHVELGLRRRHVSTSGGQRLHTTDLASKVQDGQPQALGQVGCFVIGRVRFVAPARASAAHAEAVRDDAQGGIVETIPALAPRLLTLLVELRHARVQMLHLDRLGHLLLLGGVHAGAHQRRCAGAAEPTSQALLVLGLQLGHIQEHPHFRHARQHPLQVGQHLRRNGSITGSSHRQSAPTSSCSLMLRAHVRTCARVHRLKSTSTACSEHRYDNRHKGASWDCSLFAIARALPQHRVQRAPP